MKIDFDFKNDRIPFLYLAIGVIVVSAIVIGIRLSSTDLSTIIKWEDVNNYYHQALAVFDGKVPYKDFVFEYPPLMLLFICFPMVFSKDPAVYVSIYMCMTVVFYILTVYYLNKITEKLNVGNGMLCAIMLATILFLMARIFLRNDIFAIFFIAASLYYYLEKRYTLSFLLIALGIMTKIFPIVIAFALVIPFLFRKRYVDAIRYVIVGIAVCVIVTLPFLIIDPGSAFAYLTYHSDRGLQVESVAASIIDTINLFVNIAVPSFGYGSSNITGKIPDLVAKILTPIMALLFIGLLAWCLYKKRNCDDEVDDNLVIIICTVSILIFVVFNKVFSTQYMLWIMTFISLMLCIGNDSRFNLWLLGLSILSLVFSHLETFPFYMSLIQLEWEGTIVLLIRNILVIAIFIMTVYLLKKRLDGESLGPA